MAPPFEGFYSAPQLSRWLEAMPRRFSCRKFAGAADLGQLSALSYTASRVCLKGIRIAIMPRGAEDVIVPLPLFPRFEGLSQYAVILATEGLGQAALLAGVSGQAFQLELAALGLQGCWLTGNYRRLGAMEAARPGETVMAVMPFGQPRDPEGARLSRRKALTDFSPDDPTLWPYWAYHAAEAMRFAPSALNRQPWRVSCAGNTMSFSGHKPDSIDTGIAVTHILCALGDRPHHWRLAADGKTWLIQLEETHEPV